MKVLFAIKDENISESIVRKYQQEYKEILSYKNVYYFNAILKEIQKDKTYDRIVISEDLEPFANNNYDAIDKFIFEKLDAISDEASNNSGEDIPIILICTDRRTKSDALIVRLFGIGIYSALIGQERSIDEVCNLINKPRTKKEAKSYYKVDSKNAGYQSEDEDNVSETELRNIITHYKKLGKNEDRFVNSFENIASQYTDNQLKIIIKYLPLNVKAVLEADCPKYQEIMTYGIPTWEREKARTSQNNNYAVKKQNKEKLKNKNATKDDEIKLNLVEENLKKQELTKPVIIPGIVSKTAIKKVEPITESVNSIKQIPSQANNIDEFEDIISEDEQDVTTLQTEKKGRGRPRKVVVEDAKIKNEPFTTEEPIKKGRGRPRKVVVEDVKIEEEYEQNNINILPGFDDEEDNNDDFIQDNQSYEQMNQYSQDTNILPGFDDEEDENDDFIQEDKKQYQPEYTQSTNILPGFEDDEQEFKNLNDNINKNEIIEDNYKNNYTNQQTSSLLSSDKKIVSFIGTSKNGTSFIVNNIAQMLSTQGIRTAILDLTQNNNAYYIYTNSEEELRKIAANSIENLKNGIIKGIDVNKNLAVYTSLPGNNTANSDVQKILNTITKNYDIILLDCDFDTNYEYFSIAQEIYLIQTMDILTIQPLTAFLRELKSRRILDTNKLRIVINKAQRFKGLTAKIIIGGMSKYNNPEMTCMTDLFERETIKYFTIPFDMQTYSKYLERLVDCQVSLNGYSKELLQALRELCNNVYPVLNSKAGHNNKTYGNYDIKQKKENFSSSMNSTLEQMKRKY